MKKIASVVLIAWTCGLPRPSEAQDRSPTIYETQYGYEKALRRIQGVLDVSVGGVNGDLRLILRIDGEETRKALVRLVGEEIQGHKIHFLVSPSTATSTTRSRSAEPAAQDGAGGTCVGCACPCHTRKPGTTVAADRSKPDADRAKETREECDVFREMLGLPKRTATRKDGLCRQMLGWTNDPDKIKWVVSEGLPHLVCKDIPTLRGSGNNGVDCPEHGRHTSGEFISYSYIKHQASCPMAVKQVSKLVETLTPGNK